MKRAWMLAIVMALSTAAAHAQKIDEGMPSMVESQQASVTAKVDGIDYGSRHITLRGQGGRTQSFTVPPEVKNFDQIKKGDNVVVDYYRSVLVEMAQPGEPAQAATSNVMKVAPPGDKPAAAEAVVRRATVTVRGVDKEKGTVTAALPDGETRTVVVREERRPVLDRIKVGDRIDVTMTEAVAVAVRKP